MIVIPFQEVMSLRKEGSLFGLMGNAIQFRTQDGTVCVFVFVCVCECVYV